MSANKSVAHRLGRVLEAVTRQSGRLPDTPDYGSWLLGKSSESQRRRRVRIQVILTVFILFWNLLGIAVSMLLVAVAIPVPSVFTDAPLWLTLGVVPAYIAVALVLGIFWITRRTVSALRWSIEEHPPTREDQRNTFLAPWRVAKAHLILWGVGTALLTTLYGQVNTVFIPRFLFSVGFSGVIVATACFRVG
jgi:adenylate cyclase